MSDSQDDLVPHITEIVTAHIANNKVETADIPALIENVYAALAKVRSREGQAGMSEPTKLTPAVPIAQSVFPEYIISLEDGRKLRSMKRHLRAAYGMTPEQYRAKWGLPPDYPMVAPKYAESRSEIAKTRAFGRGKSSKP